MLGNRSKLWTTIGLVILAVGALTFTGNDSNAQVTWGGPSAAEVADDGPQPTPAVTKAVGRKGLTLRQRREIGLTFKNIKRILEEKVLPAAYEETNGEGTDVSTLALMVAGELVEENPQAFSHDPSLDWDMILEFIEKLIPLILRIIALFS